jgi:hypothetical protein
MIDIHEYLVRFQDPDDAADVDVELTAESATEAIQIARGLPRFAEQRSWRVTATEVTAPPPVCNVLSIHRDGGETPTDPHYSTAPAGSSCAR